VKPYIGERELDMINMGCLQSFIELRKEEGVKNRTINHGLEITRQILNLANKEWIDDSNLTWLASAPKIRLLPQTDERKPYSLSWEEQDRLFALLPPIPKTNWIGWYRSTILPCRSLLRFEGNILFMCLHEMMVRPGLAE
jgi:hypothetical protein